MPSDPPQQRPRATALGGHSATHTVKNPVLAYFLRRPKRFLVLLGVLWLLIPSDTRHRLFEVTGLVPDYSSFRPLSEERLSALPPEDRGRSL